VWFFSKLNRVFVLIYLLSWFVAVNYSFVLRHIMRIKVQTLGFVGKHAQALRKLGNDVEVFVEKANNAAVSLYAITQLCTSLFGGARVQCEIAKKLMAVAGALSSLCAMLDISLLSTAHVELLVEQMEMCRPILTKIDVAVKTLHDHVDLGSVDGRLSGYFNAFMKGEDVEPQRILEACFRAILRVRLTAGSRGEEL
jgi:hypothetical protein